MIIKEYVTIEEIRSNVFSTKKDFLREYKLIKEKFKKELGYNKVPQGTIILCMNKGNNYIKITSNSKADMEDWIKKYKDENIEFFLLTEAQTFLIRKREE